MEPIARRLLFTTMLVLPLQACARVPNPVATKDIPVCSDSQLLVPKIEGKQLEAHRIGPFPSISYPFGTVREDWGLSLTLRIDESGRVGCYVAKDRFDRPQTINVERRAAMQSLGDLRYKPFQRNGKALAVVVEEQAREEELPEKLIPLPDVPLDEVHISLERTGCYGTCPSYRVDVYGSGRVVYSGSRYVDVEGEHEFFVPKEEVKGLVDSLRDKNLWSVRSEYSAPITDNPTYVLTLRMGKQSKTISDYVGEMVGMPATVSQFQDEVDKVARTDKWIYLTVESLRSLQSNGFAFDTQEGAGLLARAVANDDTQDQVAMLELVKLGAPLAVTGKQERGFLGTPGPLLDSALRNHRDMLLIPLVERGQLDTRGKRDQAKIDAAFKAAVEGGRLDAVKTIWGVAGARPHPALSFEDHSDDTETRAKRSPITLALSRPYRDEQWEGLEITKWLVEQGCDLKAQAANGDTLLHIATEAGDVQFVRYLLDQGLDASTPGDYDLPALGSAQNEEIAMMLLRAGTDLSLMDDKGDHFRRYAKDNNWGEVMAWLEQQKKG